MKMFNFTTTSEAQNYTRNAVETTAIQGNDPSQMTSFLPTSLDMYRVANEHSLDYYQTPAPEYPGRPQAGAAFYQPDYFVRIWS